jgi:hypothetical protein
MTVIHIAPVGPTTTSRADNEFHNDTKTQFVLFDGITWIGCSGKLAQKQIYGFVS